MGNLDDAAKRMTLRLRLMCLCFICSGKPEGTLEERWADLGDAVELIAAAPDDEILGEILALQVCCCFCTACDCALHMRSHFDLFTRHQSLVFLSYDAGTIWLIS